jgi:replicative DNA helicase
MEEDLKPRFIESLQRNNDKIREDRARTIGEDSELIYRRKVEDIELKIKRLEREQEGLIDISPLDKNSLTFADFQPEAFVQRDIELSLIIRNLNIQLEVSVKRFEYLFGKKF